MAVRTRFAPSPTGWLHIGSLRTALFAYLVARQKQGDFVLRIEDTDQKREVPGAVKGLLDVFGWLGLEFDEGPHIGGGYGPYTQSERKDIYARYAEELLDKNQAYRCFCTPERLQAMREEQQAAKQPPRYDRRCRELSAADVEARLKSGEKYVIRQKMPLRADIVVRDELRGEIKFKSNELNDHVLIKADGMPTYQFAVVVDDHLMDISHVVRGEEWIPSFPKNVLLYRAFGWEAPKFIHLPLILNKGGGKLSKRQGDVAVEDYRAQGYLPEALLNFSALLGWSPYSEEKSGDKKNPEIMNLEEMIGQFDYNRISTSNAVFDTGKLDFLNAHYIRRLDIEALQKLCQPFLEDYWDEQDMAVPPGRQINGYVKSVIALEQERLKRLSDIGELTEFFFVENLEYEPDLLVWKKMDNQGTKENLKKIIELLEPISDSQWTKESIEDAIVSYLRAKELKVGEYLWPMRAALTGRDKSPGPFEVAAILGRAETKKRLLKAAKRLA